MQVEQKQLPAFFTFIAWSPSAPAQHPRRKFNTLFHIGKVGSRMTYQQLAWARQPLASSSHALVAYPHPDGWARVVRNHLPNGEVSWRWTVHWPYRFSRSGSAQNEAAAIQAATESYWRAFKSTTPVSENAKSGGEVDAGKN